MKTVLFLSLACVLAAKDLPHGKQLTPPANKNDRVAWRAYLHSLEKWHRLSKAAARSDRKVGIHNGNRVRTLFYNYGSIGKPQTEPSMEWPIGSGRGYAFEFGVLAGAKVLPYGGDPNNPSDYIPIVDDGLVVAGVIDDTPDGSPADWEPLPGYADPFQPYIAMSDARDENRDGKPDSWPQGWYDAHFGTYVWPGEYGKNVTTADQESYYRMDDYYIKSHNWYWPLLKDKGWRDSLRVGEFYPDTTDYVRGGLGLEVEARGYQWVSTRAQNVIFFIYNLTNVGTDTLRNLYFGMYGDPHIGGANDYSDDDAYYDTFLDMVYAWDDNARGGPEFADVVPGFFGYKFLESPGEPYDRIDNDEDGMVDESMQDGIDNDGDWMPYDDLNLNGKWDQGEPLNDDLGSDGVGPEDPNYPGPDLDGSEANGLPDHGEPNFDETDLDEADQIGLTGFAVEAYSGNTRSDSYFYYNRLANAIIDSLFKQNADNIFVYSSGPITMAPGDSRRFSITMLFGYNTSGAGGIDLPSNPHNTRDLYATAEVMQDIYNAGYRFVKPPLKPHLTAVAGDGQVTLYWDATAEKSRDPLYGHDFEGYAIYRATDFGFEESQTVTDAYGNPYLWKPIAKFDKIDDLKGPFPIEQIPGSGLHYDMGSNTGLVHSFVDRDVINGQRYFYAVCAYDTGSVRDTIPPTETSKNIQESYTGEIQLDVNTAVVIPQAPSVGYVPPSIETSGDQSGHDGPGTGQIQVNILDPTLIPDNRTFQIRFVDSETDEVDNDGDWQTFTDDTTFIPNSPYVDLVIPPTSDSTIYQSDEEHVIVDRFSVGSIFTWAGLLWRVNQYLEGGNKDTVIIYPDTVILGPTLGVWDPTVDGPVYDDVGSDGCSDEYEIAGGGCSDTVVAVAGSDPHGDNWDPVDNPDGTEANGKPDSGEPDLDYLDLQEKMRATQYYDVYDVTDPDNPFPVVEHETALHGEEPAYFVNGLKIEIQNDTLRLDSASVKWIAGDAVWEADIRLYKSTNINGIAYPKDYKIIFYNQIVDTAVVPQADGSMKKVGRGLVFKVYDETTQEVVDVKEIGMHDSVPRPGNSILPIIYQNPDHTGPWTTTWMIQFSSALENVRCVLPSGNGFFVGTYSKGLHYYDVDNETWTHWTRNSTGGGLLADRIYDLASIDGYIWVATGYGPAIFDGQQWYHNVRLETIFDDWAPDDTKQLEDPEKSKKYEPCRAIVQDRFGNIWLGSNKFGLVKANTQGTYNTSMDDDIELIDTPDSLDIHFSDGDLNAMFIDSNDTLWALTNSGLIGYNIVDGTWTTYTKDNQNGLKNKKFYCGLELADGTLVFGTGKGVAIKLGTNFQVVTKTDGYLPDDRIYSLATYGDSLYIGTAKGFAAWVLSGPGSTGEYQIEATIHRASYGPETISQEDDIRAIAFNDQGIGFFGTKEGPEERLSPGHWNSFSPEPGDIFRFGTHKPFSHLDTYTFTTHAAREDEDLVKADLSKVAVVPDPYICTARWERKPYLQSGRGERRIYFINLPKDCTIRIYTLSGELVRKLEHHSTVFAGSEPWDLLNTDNLEVAYGIYIYHVQAGAAETIGRFAIIK